MPGVDLDTWASARWNFHSGRTEREADLPLLDIRYDLPLDLASRAPKGAFAFGGTATRRTGGRAVAPTLEYSADDGLTWHPALVLPTGGGTWDVRVTNPDNGFVSLRTTARDADGGSATETLTRACRVG